MLCHAVKAPKCSHDLLSISRHVLSSLPAAWFASKVTDRKSIKSHERQNICEHYLNLDVENDPSPKILSVVTNFADLAYKPDK